jgi:hypothetical protein
MKKLLKNTRTFFNNIGGWYEGWYQVNVSQRDVIYAFYGFNHFNFAKKYAEKRHKRNGLKHWVVPAGKGAESLVVFNTREKDSLQAQGLMSRRVKAYDLMKAAYHTSAQNNKKK